MSTGLRLAMWPMASVLPFCAWPVMATSIVFPGHWKTLGSTQPVMGFRFPAGTEVQVLNDTGAATGNVVLHRSLKVDGHWLKSGTHLMVFAAKGAPPHLAWFFSEPGQHFHGIDLPEGTQVDFDAQGRLADMSSNEGTPIVIRGLLFAGNSWIEFHPNGRVRHGELLKGFVVDGLQVQPGPIEFHPNGRISRAWIGAGSMYHTLKLAPADRSFGFDVEFWPDGGLKQAVLAGVTAADGKTCPAGHVSFRQDGTLDECDGSRWIR
ncbi:MAG TPA: hypothetical protein VJR95_09220 [Rhodanobacter sp.]|nr:hypothetical protein [Rhodanobacter sp.]